MEVYEINHGKIICLRFSFFDLQYVDFKVAYGYDAVEYLGISFGLDTGLKQNEINL